MRTTRTLLALGVLGLVSALTVVANDPDPGGRPLSTSMNGAAEVPGPGDPDGTGTAKITLNHGQGQVCYELTVTGIGEATLAHIHDGDTGEAGPPVVTLEAPADGSSDGCVDASQDLIKDIVQNPAGYYVNVHNAEYPNGAVRGQLGK